MTASLTITLSDLAAFLAKIARDAAANKEHGGGCDERCQ